MQAILLDLPIELWVTTNSAFLPFIMGICFLAKYFETREKLKVALMTWSKQTQNLKADNFFELTDYKQIFKNSQNFSANIVFYRIYSQIHHLNLVSICSLFMINDSLNHELFI